MSKLFSPVQMVSDLFRKPSVPAMETPTRAMPVADDDAIKRARLRSIAAMQARSGRASTILSQGERLGD